MPSSVLEHFEPTSANAWPQSYIYFAFYPDDGPGMKSLASLSFLSAVRLAQPNDLHSDSGLDYLVS